MRQLRPLRPGIRIGLLVVVPLLAALVITWLLLSPDDSTDVDAEGAPSTTITGAPTTAAPPTTAPPTTAPPTTAATAAGPEPTDPNDSDPGDVPAPPTPAFTSAVEAVTAEQLGASWHDGCPVRPDQLRLVTVSHWGFDSVPRQGQLVIHADHAAAIVAVMQALYVQGFAIERMEPVSVFGGDDDASMAANNTSAFNCRTVAGSDQLSEHSWGWAIDVNPIQNPYVRGGTVDPPAGAAYTDRGNLRQGMIVDGDGTMTAFASIGWSWGGHWTSGQDYQHFSASGR